MKDSFIASHSDLMFKEAVIKTLNKKREDEKKIRNKRLTRKKKRSKIKV